LYDLAETQRIRLEQELGMARAVQKVFANPAQYPCFTLVADWRSAHESLATSMTFFATGGSLGLVLADVSGKGHRGVVYGYDP